MFLMKLRSSFCWKPVNVYLLLVIALGAILRFYRLSAQSFWIDEVLSIKYTQQGFFDLGNPPLSYVILWVFLEVFGTNEFTARLSACLFGIAAIPLVYFFGKQLLTEKEGLVASFIMSISPWHIRWSQEARMYTELMVFTLLTLYFFYYAIHNKNLKSYLVSSIFMVLAFYTHYSAILILGIIVFWLSVESFSAQRRSNIDFRYLVIFFVIIFILFVPLFNTHIPRAIDFKFNGVERRWGAPTIEYFIFRMFIHEIGPFFFCFSFIGAVLLVVRRNTAAIILILYATIPLVTFSLLVFKMNVILRYVLFTLPAYALLTAFLVINTIEKIKSEINKEFPYIALKKQNINIILSIGAVLSLLFTIYTIPNLSYYYTIGAHPDWKAACLYVQSRQKSNDDVASTNKKMVEYYLGHCNYEIIEENFGKIKNSFRRVWLFVDSWGIDGIGPNNEFRDWLTSDCTHMHEVHHINIYLFDPT